MILIFIGTVFSSKYARFNTLASIINAQQLLNTNYNTFNAKQKSDFIKEIDSVLTFLGNENRLLNIERHQTLNSRQIEKQTELDVSNQKLSKATSELSNLTNNLNSLNSRLKTLNDSRSETNKQCNRLRSAQRINCRNKLNTIDTNIRNVRNQISSTQNSINNSRSNLNNAQIEVNTKNTELRLIKDKIVEKQAEIYKIEQTIARLSQFKLSVMNYSNNNNNVAGCTDSAASNYNPNATVSDGSCLIPGCMNQMASNYNANANTDDGSCEYSKKGCTFPLAVNYDPRATEDDGTCYF